MCLNPIKIRNRKIDKNILSDKEYLYVPCGKCIECRRAYQRSYEIRAYYEWKQTLDSGGSTYFYTLTYDNKHLPKVVVQRSLPACECPTPVRPLVSHAVKYVPNWKSVPCFDKTQVQLFLRRLDARIVRNYGCRLRYFLTCEFGTHGTKRSHYHVLFFTERFISPAAFRRLVSETWTFGFNCPGKYFGAVQNINAVRYVAKYVSKDIAASEAFAGLEDELEYKNIAPFHLQSQGFGLYALTQLSDLQKQYGTCLLPTEKNDGYVEVALPTYLLRKRFYEVVKNSKGTNSYVLNDLGKVRSVLLFERNKKNLCDLFTMVSNNQLSNITEFKTELQHEITKHFGCSSLEAPEIMDCVLDGRSPNLFINYYLIYRGRNCSLPVVENQDGSEILASFLAVHDSLPFEDSIYQKKYEDMDEFKGFESFISLLELIKSWNKYSIYKRGVQKYNSIQRQRVSKGVYKELKLLDELSFLDYLNSCPPLSKILESLNLN